MTVLYSLVLIFSINGTQFSESSLHKLTLGECGQRMIKLQKKIHNEMIISWDTKTNDTIFEKGERKYVCIPTSIKEEDWLLKKLGFK